MEIRTQAQNERSQKTILHQKFHQLKHIYIYIYPKFNVQVEYLCVDASSASTPSFRGTSSLHAKFLL